MTGFSFLERDLIDAITCEVNDWKSIGSCRREVRINELLQQLVPTTILFCTTIRIVIRPIIDNSYIILNNNIWHFCMPEFYFEEFFCIDLSFDSSCDFVVDYRKSWHSIKNETFEILERKIETFMTLICCVSKVKSVIDELPPL